MTKAPPASQCWRGFHHLLSLSTTFLSGCCRLHIGIPLCLDDGGERVQSAGDLILRLCDLLRDGLALLSHEDTRGIGKLQLQVRQYCVLLTGGETYERNTENAL